MIFTVPVIYLEDAKKLIEKQSKKLDSIGVKHTESYGTPYFITLNISGIKGMEQRVEVVDVEFTSSDIYKIKGFEVVAVLEHPVSSDENSENLVYLIGNNNITKNDIEILQRLKSNCSHCHTKRVRKKTVILYNEEQDKLIQVGLSCLNNYLGVDISGKLDRLSDIERMLNGELDKYDIMNGSREWSSINTKLNAGIISAIMIMAYDKYKESMLNTKSVVDRLNEYTQLYNNLSMNEKQAYLEKGNNIVNKFANLESVEGGFELNLRALCRNYLIRRKNVRMAAWIPAVYSKITEKAQQEKKYKEEWEQKCSGSQYYGNEGDKLGEIKVICERLLTTKEVYINEYNTAVSYVYSLKMGNYWFIWSTGNALKDGIEYTLKGGKIKKHQEYNGLKQTVISRCKIVSSSDGEYNTVE